MASSTNMAGVDMNDPGNLSFFSEILLFKNDQSRGELQFKNRSSSEQRILQSIAHSMSLEFEYSIRTRTVTISRTVPFEPEAPADQEIPDIYMDSTDFLHNFGMDSFPGSGDFEFLYFSQGADIANVGDSKVDCAEKDIRHETAISATELELFPNMFQNQEVPRYSQSIQELDELPSTDDNLSPNFQTGGTNPAGDPSVTCLTCGGICERYSTLCNICKLSRPSLSLGACICCRGRKIKCDREVPCTGCAESWSFPCVYSVPDDRPTLPSKSSRSIANACISCRRRKIRCDKESPCRTCRRSGVPCESPTPVVDQPSTEPFSFMRGFLSLRNRSAPPLKRKHSVGSVSPEPMEFHSPLPDADRGRRESMNQSSGLGQPESFNWPTTNLSNSFNVPSYSRRGSGASGGYQEIVFDSNSVHSGSQASVASGASGRRGPLSDWARAGMNAVKKVGACWRCKFLRKTCDPQDPCPLCPKGDKSSWAAVGCNRGPFKHSSVPLCTAATPRDLLRLSAAPETEELEKAVASLEITTQGESWFDPTVELDPEDDKDTTWPQKVEVRRLVLRNISRSYESFVHHPLPNTLTPLSDCVLAITRELLHCPSVPGISCGERFFDDMVQLLPAAAVCQAKIETDQLIAQSLICLRSCAKAMRAKEAGLLDSRYHGACLPPCCNIDCVDIIDGHLKRYLDELSTVMFKKTNMLDKRLSWLSIFYSFCIQSIVRKTLIELMKDLPNKAWNGESFQASRYLYLPLRLFIAGSGSYDPLNQITNEKSDERPNEHLEDFPRDEDFRDARRAVGQSDWKTNNISSSGDYLQKLFEDDGSPLKTPKPIAGIIDAHTQAAHILLCGVNLLKETENLELTRLPSARHEDIIYNSCKQKAQCPFCTEEKMFSRKDALKRHIRVIHPERFEDYLQEDSEDELDDIPFRRPPQKKPRGRLQL